MIYFHKQQSLQRGGGGGGGPHGWGSNSDREQETFDKQWASHSRYFAACYCKYDLRQPCLETTVHHIVFTSRHPSHMFHVTNARHYYCAGCLQPDCGAPAGSVPALHITCSPSLADGGSTCKKTPSVLGHEHVGEA